MTYLIKKTYDNLKAEIGKEKTLELMFTIMASANKKEVVYNDDLYAFWFNQLPKGFKFPSIKRFNGFVPEIPKTELDLMKSVLDEKSDDKEFVEFSLLTKAQKTKVFKSAFDGAEKNDLGLPTITVEAEVPYSDEYNSFGYQMAEFNVLLAPNGFFLLNENRVMGWDELIERYTGFLFRNHSENTVTDFLINFFER